MSSTSTKELMDMFFATKPESMTKKIRAQLDRPELYKYEEESGKQIIEWDANDVISFLSTVSTHGRKMSIRSLDTIVVFLRGFYQWYIEEIGLIRNPCNDRSIKGKVTEIVYEQTKSDKVFTREMLERACASFSAKETPEYAIYYEAILRMAYEGFPEISDIVYLKEEDFSGNVVTVRGVKHKLSDRLMSILRTIHETEIIDAFRGKYIMVSYNGSYFKFPTREIFADREHDAHFYTLYLARIYTNKIKPAFDFDVKYRTVFLTGFYDMLCEKYGKDTVNDLILVGHKYENRELNVLMQEAINYGLSATNSTHIRKALRICVR